MHVKVQTWLKHCCEKDLLNDDHKYIFYTSENGKLIDDTLSNVNESWATVSLVACTPKITVGISYDLLDFVTCYMDLSNVNAAGPRDMLQSMMRVRHLQSNTVHFTMPSRIIFSNAKKLLYKSFSEYEDAEQDKQAIILDHVKKTFKDEECNEFVSLFEMYAQGTDPIMKQLLYANMRETIISQTHFKELFLR